MALINTLREKAGKLLVVVISLSIGAFVLGDLLGNNSLLFGNNNSVGEINGKSISLEEFQNVIREVESKYVANFQRTPTENERSTLRQQAWELLVVRYAFQEQYDQVGVEVTDDEIWDMLQGKNISPSIQQAFVNPETGQFDRQSFLQYLQNVPNLPPAAQAQWNLFRSDLQPGRERLKYENLLVKSNFVTNAEAQREYASQNNVAEVKYLYVPAYAVSDTAIGVTESQLTDYYNKNKERYKTDGTRSLKYVTFAVVPSAQDTAALLEEIEEIKQELKTVSDDSVYASVNTDGANFYGSFHRGILPTQLKDNVDNLEVGGVYGPYLDASGMYKVFKVSEAYEDTVDYARASHILFGKDDEAEKKANEVLREIQNGGDFATLARQYGTDGTASKGGDLGWAYDGKYVTEFNEAVFARNTPGLINRVVETEFGFHVLRVDNPKTRESFKVATVEREIIAGEETRNTAYREADFFASEAGDLNEFEAKAEEKGYTISPALSVGKNDRRLGVLGNARQVIQWLFRDASLGSVSEVYDLEDQYAVVVMTDELEEGYQPLDKVKTEVTAKVKNELKAEQIISKLKGLSGSLDEIASAYGADANVYTTSDLKLNTNSVPNVGYAPLAVGKIFALEAGTTSEPFATESGVLIVEMINKTEAPEIADYATYKTQIEQNMINQVSFSISEAIKKDAEIEDKRYKFF